MKELVLLPLVCSSPAGGLLPAVPWHLDYVSAAVWRVWCNFVVLTRCSLLGLTDETTTLRNTRGISRDIVTIGNGQTPLRVTGILVFRAHKKHSISMKKPKKCIARSCWWWNRKLSKLYARIHEVFNWLVCSKIDGRYKKRWMCLHIHNR